MTYLRFSQHAAPPFRSPGRGVKSPGGTVARSWHAKACQILPGACSQQNNYGNTAKMQLTIKRE